MTCRCGEPMFPQYDRAGRRVVGHVCQGCGAEAGAGGAAIVVAPKLPGLDRGRQRRSAPVYKTEGDLQAAIVRRLRAGGHVVLSTSRHRRGVVCARCGAWTMPQGGDGADRGVPDLLVHADGARWIGIEVKGHRTEVSPEQAALAEAGRIVIVRSVEEAVGACGPEGGRQKEEPTSAHTGAHRPHTGPTPATPTPAHGRTRTCTDEHGRPGGAPEDIGGDRHSNGGDRHSNGGHTDRAGLKPAPTGIRGSR